MALSARDDLSKESTPYQLAMVLDGGLLRWIMLQSWCAKAGYRLPVPAAKDLADIHTLDVIKHIH